MNRLDKIVTFQPLGSEQLKQDPGHRTEHGAAAHLQHVDRSRFCVHALGCQQGLPAVEGTDLKYGARHLKRAIERLLVQPISNLIATDQVRGGDCLSIDFDPTSER